METKKNIEMIEEYGKEVIDQNGKLTWGQKYYGQPSFPVVCIKNYWNNKDRRNSEIGKRLLPLTIGKVYMVETDHTFNTKLSYSQYIEYIITADNNFGRFVPTEYFVSLQEFRTMKLKRILNENS